MTTKKQSERMVRLSRLLNSPAVKKDVELKLSNGDNKVYSPGKMPSAKRVKAVNKAFLSVL